MKDFLFVVQKTPAKARFNIGSILSHARMVKIFFDLLEPGLAGQKGDHYPPLKGGKDRGASAKIARGKRIRITGISKPL